MTTVRTQSAAARVVGRYVVFVHDSTDPTDTEWEKLLELFRKLPGGRMPRTLVYTGGGAPNAAQRARLLQTVRETFGSGAFVVAVFTESALARAAGTAISWFIPGIRIFGPNDIDQALDHLGGSSVERATVKVALAELRSELAPSKGRMAGTSRP
jgi:hypothetical protein